MVFLPNNTSIILIEVFLSKEDLDKVASPVTKLSITTLAIIYALPSYIFLYIQCKTVNTDSIVFINIIIYNNSK